MRKDGTVHGLKVSTNVFLQYQTNIFIMHLIYTDKSVIYAKLFRKGIRGFKCANPLTYY